MPDMLQIFYPALSCFIRLYGACGIRCASSEHEGPRYLYGLDGYAANSMGFACVL